MIKLDFSEPMRFQIVLGMAVVLVLAARMAFFSNGLLADPDTWWHIKAGADMWSSFTFPATDTYSHTFNGQPWIAKEWLSQIALYGSFTAAGWNGVLLTGILGVCLLTAVLYFVLCQHVKPLAAATIALPMVFLTSPTFLARPHILTLALAVYWTYRLFECSRLKRPPEFWLLALLVLWANLHAGFTLGFVIAFFAFLDFIERTRLSERAALAKWIAFLALCPMAALIHPYTYQAMLATWTIAGPNEAVPLIIEWQPFNAQVDVFHEGAILAMVFALMVARVTFTFAKAAFLVFTLHMFLIHARFCYAFFPLMPVVIAAEIAQRFPALSARHWREEKRDAVERAVAQWFRPIAAVALVAGIVFSAAMLKVLPAEPAADVAAAGAIAYARDRNISGNVMNGYSFGGPLIFHGIPTYIDGRNDQLFRGGFSLNDYEMQQAGGEKLFLEALERHDIRWTLFSPQDPRNGFLAGLKDWTRAYADDYAVIHVASPP